MSIRLSQAPSGNALHFDRLSAVSKVEPSAAAEASTELSRTSRAVLKPNLLVSTSAASLALPSVAHSALLSSAKDLSAPFAGGLVVVD